MRLISERTEADSKPGRWQRYGGSAAVVAAAAVVGSAAVDPDSTWYRTLRKPSWHPPSWAFGVAWTPLYASLAFAGGHAVGRAQGRERRAITASFGVNLALNAAWTWLFFGCRNPRAGAVGTLVLDASNIELIRRVARSDSTAARALLPYAGWCAFATALNASIARRSRS